MRCLPKDRRGVRLLCEIGMRAGNRCGLETWTDGCALTVELGRQIEGRKGRHIERGRSDHLCDCAEQRRWQWWGRRRRRQRTHLFCPAYLDSSQSTLQQTSCSDSPRKLHDRSPTAVQLPLLISPTAARAVQWHSTTVSHAHRAIHPDFCFRRR